MDFRPLVSRLLAYLPTAFITALVVYFGVQALSGDRGLLQARERRTALAQSQARLAALRTENAEREIRARLLRSDSLSADLLEERARVLLGFAHPSDYVIRVNPAAG